MRVFAYECSHLFLIQKLNYGILDEKRSVNLSSCNLNSSKYLKYLQKLLLNDLGKYL